MKCPLSNFNQEDIAVGREGNLYIYLFVSVGVYRKRHEICGPWTRKVQAMGLFSSCLEADKLKYLPGK